MADSAPDEAPLQPTLRPSALWPAVWLAVALVGAKAVHWGAPSPGSLVAYARDLGVSAWQDLLFAVGFFGAAQAALALASFRGKAGRSVWPIIAGLGSLFVVYAVASVQIFAYLRSPLTYPLLYLAGDMSTMRSSLGSFLSPTLVTALVAAPILYLLCVRATSRAFPVRATRRAAVLQVLGVAVVAAAGLRGRLEAAGKWSDRDDRLIALNPHWALAVSSTREIAGGHALAADDPFPPEYLRDFEAGARPGTRARVAAGARPRNVILIVLESTGTRYLSLYGSRYDTTPLLATEARHALVFDDFYCHVGMSANSMAAITLALFPYMTWREYTVEYPDLPGTTLAEVLRRRGYRTAFMHSGDLQYAGGGAFLRNRGFDDIVDSSGLGCETALSSWGCEDRYLVDGLLRWIDRDRRAPFFVMAWTAQSHHPYEPSPGRPFVDFFQRVPRPPDDYDLGRYLNTLREVDSQLGRVFDGLRERDLAAETLVVLTGDHGEAFGDPHETWGHGARLYEENVKVPLILWNPRLFPRGLRSATLGSHVDLNRTVADLLSLPPPEAWHGRSLFDRLRPPRAYFYAANDDYLLGVREGDWKYVYNVTAGRDELYDLRLDPAERRNLAAGQAERALRLRHRLAAWKHFVGRELAGMRLASPTTTGDRGARPPR